jgi:hypothetical protein
MKETPYVMVKKWEFISPIHLQPSWSQRSPTPHQPQHTHTHTHTHMRAACCRQSMSPMWPLTWKHRKDNTQCLQFTDRDTRCTGPQTDSKQNYTTCRHQKHTDQKHGCMPRIRPPSPNYPGSVPATSRHSLTQQSKLTEPSNPKSSYLKQKA